MGLSDSFSYARVESPVFFFEAFPLKCFYLWGVQR